MKKHLSNALVMAVLLVASYAAFSIITDMWWPAFGQQAPPISNSGGVVLDTGTVSRVKPIRRADGATAPDRVDTYGGYIVTNTIPTKHTLADEGSYFVASMTAGSSQAIFNGTSFSATSGLIALKNNDQQGNPNSKRMYLDYVKLFGWSAVPTSATSVHMLVATDNINRAPSAGSTTMTINNVNMDDYTGSIAQAYAVNLQSAQMTIPAAGPSVRQLTQCLLSSRIPVVQDSMECYFGAVEGAGGSIGTTAGRVVTNGAPVVIGAQQWAIFHVWMPSAAAVGSAELEVAWWER